MAADVFSTIPKMDFFLLSLFFPFSNLSIAFHLSWEVLPRSGVKLSVDLCHTLEATRKFVQAEKGMIRRHHHNPLPLLSTLYAAFYTIPIFGDCVGVWGLIVIRVLTVVGIRIALIILYTVRFLINHDRVTWHWSGGESEREQWWSTFSSM